MLDPEVIGEIERRLRRAMKQAKRPDSEAEIAKLTHEVENIVAAIGQGLLSPALRTRLVEAEAEIERLRSAPKPADVTALLPKLPALIRQKVLEIERLAEREPVRARQSIKAALEAETVTLRPSKDGRHLVAEYGLEPVQLATGTVSMCGSGGPLCSFPSLPFRHRVK